MPKTVLIMTATIRPSLEIPGVSRLDPAVRLSDYEEGLKFYLQFLDKGLDAICFAENSGADLSSLRAVAARAGAADRVHFTDQRGLEFPPAYGRCYGEAALLDRAMMELASRGTTSDTIFWKVTGRYKVVNFAKMMRTRPRTADLYIDIRNTRAQRWADMRVMSWTLRGYEAAMRGVAPLIREDTNNNRPGEEALFQVLPDRLGRGGIDAVTSFVTEPLIDGVRAFDERNWMAGRQRAVYLARNLQRTLLGRVVI